MNSRLRKVAKTKKQAAYVISKDEEGVLEKFPNAEKVSEYMYKARNNGMIYHIAYDSSFDVWKVLLRSKSESNVVKKMLDYFTELLGI